MTKKGGYKKKRKRSPPSKFLFLLGRTAIEEVFKKIKWRRSCVPIRGVCCHTAQGLWLLLMQRFPAVALLLHLSPSVRCSRVNLPKQEAPVLAERKKVFPEPWGPAGPATKWSQRDVKEAPFQIRRLNTWGWSWPQRSPHSLQPLLHSGQCSFWAQCEGLCCPSPSLSPPAQPACCSDSPAHGPDVSCGDDKTETLWVTVMGHYPPENTISSHFCLSAPFISQTSTHH